MFLRHIITSLLKSNNEILHFYPKIKIFLGFQINIVKNRQLSESGWFRKYFFLTVQDIYQEDIIQQAGLQQPNQGFTDY